MRIDTCSSKRSLRVLKLFRFSVLVMKMSNLHETSKGNDEEEEDDDDDDSDNEDDEKTPDLAFASVKHLGCINRIRVCKQNFILLLI